MIAVWVTTKVIMEMEEIADFDRESSSEPSVDLNKAFYFDEDLEMDLKQVEDPIMEDANFDLKCLSLNSKQKKSVSFSPMFSVNSEISSHASEKLLSEAVDEVFNKKNPWSKFKSFEFKKKSKMIPVQTVLDLDCMSFPQRSSPGEISKESTHCQGFGKIQFPRQTIKDKAKSCQKKKHFPKKYLSHSLIIGSRSSLKNTRGA